MVFSYSHQFVKFCTTSIQQFMARSVSFSTLYNVKFSSSKLYCSPHNFKTFIVFMFSYFKKNCVSASLITFDCLCAIFNTSLKQLKALTRVHTTSGKQIGYPLSCNYRQSIFLVRPISIFVFKDGRKPIFLKICDIFF